MTTFGRIDPLSRLVSPVRCTSDIIRVGMLAPSSCAAMNSSLCVIFFSAGCRCSLIGRTQVRTMPTKILANGCSAHRRLLLVRYDEERAPLVRHFTAFGDAGARERCAPLGAQRFQRQQIRADGWRGRLREDEAQTHAAVNMAARIEPVAPDARVGVGDDHPD